MKLTLRYGLIFAGAAISWSLLEILLANQFGFFELSTITSILAFIIPLIILIIALRQDKQEKAMYRLSDAIKTGFIISSIGSIIYSVYLYILYTIYPQVINPYLAYLEEQLAAKNTSAEEIENALQQVQNQFSAINQAVFSFVLTLSIGLIMSYFIGKKIRTQFSHTEISATPE